MKHILFALLGLFSLNCFAASPTFNNLSDADFDTISKEFSSLFIHNSVNPPTSLGKIFGVEAAIIAGVSKTAGVEAISKRFDPNMSLPYAPFATLYGALSVPYGITIETNILPSMNVSGLDLQHYSGAVKWTLTESVLPVMPFDLALRTYFSQSKLGFTQNVTVPIPSSVDVDYKNSMFGTEALIGLDLLIVQPYGGMGFVRTNSEMTAVASLNPAYSLFSDGSHTKKNAVTSARYVLGCQFNLTLLKLAVEYNRVFGTDRAAIKVGFAF